MNSLEAGFVLQPYKKNSKTWEVIGLNPLESGLVLQQNIKRPDIDFEGLNPLESGLVLQQPDNFAFDLAINGSQSPRIGSSPAT